MKPTLPHLRNILVVRNDRMGDLLMSLPVARALRQAFPQARITLLVHQAVAPLIKDHPDLDSLQIWDPVTGQGWLAMVRWAWRMRQGRYDCVLILNPTKLFHVASFLAGIPIRAGYSRKAGKLLTHTISDTKSERHGREADFNLELVRLLGADPGEPKLTLPVTPEKERELSALLSHLGCTEQNSAIAIHPWTSNPIKSWPQQDFVSLAARLEELKTSAWIIGGPESVDEMRTWPKNRGVNLVGKIPLHLLPVLLSRCTALVSNDSGPVHVAAAVEIPALVVAPQSHVKLLERWKPLGSQHRLLIEPQLDEVVGILKEMIQPSCES